MSGHQGPLRAIETAYAGCRFRSRTEARWAIFMDELDVSWEFEAQGFHTPAGGYLPDFWLPDVDLYVEIKGPRPGDQELAKCQAVPNLIILVGGVPRHLEDMEYWRWEPCGKGWPHLIHRCEEGWVINSAEKDWPFPSSDADLVAGALTAARSARFEHGENGRSR